LRQSPIAASAANAATIRQCPGYPASGQFWIAAISEGDDTPDPFVSQHTGRRLATAAIHRVKIGTANGGQGYFDEALTGAKLNIQAPFDKFERPSSAVKHGELCSDHALCLTLGLFRAATYSNPRFSCAEKVSTV
jgi:hypothetical protein